MTKLIGTTLVIEGEPDGVCQLCGAEEETRPYGPNGEDICFACGMKDEATTAAQFQKILDKANRIVRLAPLRNE